MHVNIDLASSSAPAPTPSVRETGAQTNPSDPASLPSPKRKPSAFAEAMQALLVAPPLAPLEPSTPIPMISGDSSASLGLTDASVANAPAAPLPSPTLLASNFAALPGSATFAKELAATQLDETSQGNPTTAATPGPIGPAPCPIVDGQTAAQLASNAAPAAHGSTSVPNKSNGPAQRTLSDLTGVDEEHASASETPSPQLEQDGAPRQTEDLAPADQPALSAQALWSLNEEDRAPSPDSVEKATQAPTALPVEQGPRPPSSSRNHAEPIEPPIHIADQIKDAVLTRIDAVRRSGRTEIHVFLDPPELGRVGVHLTSSDDRVSGRLVVHEEAARSLLEHQLPELRQRLESAGVTLGRFDVSQDGAAHSDAPWRRAPRLGAAALESKNPALGSLAPSGRAQSIRSLIDLLA